MAIGFVGRKAGMTRIFTDEGESIPVTVIEAGANRVTQVRTSERDGYPAIQVAFGVCKPNRVSKPLAGHYAKAGTVAGRGLHEFRLDRNDGEAPEVGVELGVDQFEVGQRIDVRGVSKGKGFQGAVKRHNFRTQDNSHGNSLSHRAPGSVGQNQTPGRVFKGKRMAGQMGNVWVAIQNLEVVRVDAERQLLLVKGAVPGSSGRDVIVTPSVKAKG